MSTLASEKGVKSARSNMSGGEFKVTDGAGIHGEERVKLPDGAMIGGRERVNVTDRVRNHGEEGVKVSDGAVGNGDDEVSDKVGEEGVKRGVMVEGVDTTRSPLQLASYVHVCHDVVNSALGMVHKAVPYTSHTRVFKTHLFFWFCACMKSITPTHEQCMCVLCMPQACNVLYWAKFHLRGTQGAFASYPPPPPLLDALPSTLHHLLTYVVEGHYYPPFPILSYVQFQVGISLLNTIL